MAEKARRAKKEENRKDEMLLCENCGLTFLWSIEEQNQALKQRTEQREKAGKIDPPAYCPGCRTLLPEPGRERGLVKWYNSRKNYGFIMRQEAPDIFVHRSQLEDVKRLREDDLVEFTVSENERGPMAADVRLIERS